MIASNSKTSWVGGDPWQVALVACAHLISWPQLYRFTRAAGGLVAAVEHVGDVVDLLGAMGIAGSPAGSGVRRERSADGCAPPGRARRACERAA
jgi:hypothetical protein